jgi:hypothetical protein
MGLDYRAAVINELGARMAQLHQARKLALAKGVLTDRQARRLSKAMHALEDEINAVVGELIRKVAG